MQSTHAGILFHISAKYHHIMCIDLVKSTGIFHICENQNTVIMTLIL